MVFSHSLSPASLPVLEKTERVHVLRSKVRALWSGKDLVACRDDLVRSFILGCLG